MITASIILMAHIFTAKLLLDYIKINQASYEALLIVTCISGVLWGFYVILSFCAVLGIHPHNSPDLMVSSAIHEVIQNPHLDKGFEPSKYFSYTEGLAKFWLTMCFSIAVYSFLIHWSIFLVIITIGFVIYFKVQKKEKEIENKRKNR